MEKKALLSKVGLFSGLNEDDLDRLAEFCVDLIFKKDEILIQQGDKGVGLYVIASGESKASRPRGPGFVYAPWKGAVMPCLLRR